MSTSSPAPLKPCCVWFTGLSGAGKTTVAKALDAHLKVEGVHTVLLDGDVLRTGLNSDLGFSEADRTENIRRMAEVARLMVDAGLVVLVSAISPYAQGRDFARQRMGEGRFVEVFVDTPLTECQRRDPKGLYAKVRDGALKQFTGIDSPYEAPLRPEVHLRTVQHDAQACANEVLAFLKGEFI